MAAPIRALVISEIKGLIPACQRALQGAGLAERVTLTACAPDDAALADATILLADPGMVSGIIDSAAQLQWMQGTWAGVETLFKGGGHEDRTFICTRFAGAFGPMMAEYVISHVLDHERRFALARDLQAAKTWDPEPFKHGPRKLSQCTLGILGYGQIGAAVGRAAKAFGMRCVALKRDPTTGVDAALVDAATANVSDVLAASDFVVNILPSTPATRGLLDGEVLPAAAAKAPVFINVGRGDVVSEATLLRALEQGWLSACVLDVFAEEPLPATSALWSHPRVTITPHVAAVSLPDDVAEVFAANFRKFLDGEPLDFVVDWERGY